MSVHSICTFVLNISIWPTESTVLMHQHFGLYISQSKSLLHLEHGYKKFSQCIVYLKNRYFVLANSFLFLEINLYKKNKGKGLLQPSAHRVSGI